MKKRRISKEEAEFARKYVECGKPGEAYKFAHVCKNLTNAQISSRATATRNRRPVKELIESLQKKVSKDAEFGIAQVVEIWQDIATADPNELMSNLRRCCRHCYGRGHHYQWKDKGEFAYVLGQALKSKPEKGQPRDPLPSDEGGYGFNFTFRPHPECTECKGEGHLDTFFADTRKLSRQGRRLYAGVKQTAQGMQVLTRDQDAALANLAKFYGMMQDKLQVTGADGGPLLSATMPLPADPVEAANLYAEFIKKNARG
jgi:phage terminase small subunit